MLFRRWRRGSNWGLMAGAKRSIIKDVNLAKDSGTDSDSPITFEEVGTVISKFDCK